MTKSAELCTTCKKPKGSYHCDLCGANTCKACAHFLGEETFSFMKVVPEELKHTTYCSNCFDDKVAAPLAEYEETMEKAKEIIVFFKNQGKLTRFLKRKEDPYKVENCADEEEALMRMSFFAVQSGFNALIDVELTHKRAKVGTYLKGVVDGSAMGIQIDPDSINSDCFRGV